MAAGLFFMRRGARRPNSSSLSSAWTTPTTSPRPTTCTFPPTHHLSPTRRRVLVAGQKDPAPKMMMNMTLTNSTANGRLDTDHSTESTCSVPPPPLLPKFAFNEITLGRVVGQGGFCIVTEIRSMDLQDIYDTSEEETRVRRQLARAVNDSSSQHQHRDGTSPSGGGGGYVLKTLRTDLPDDDHVKGVLDLAIEADFLRVLQHDHIICMRGMAQTDPHHPRFFVILDRLTVTLESKFNLWRKVVGENAGMWIPCWGYCCAKPHGLHAVWKERLVVARDMARAVSYLHDQNIVYRDLKPDNLGFDYQGQVRLFDFGLAKRLEQVEKAGGGLYLLTGNTGSLRYMAPEVAKDEPYDLSVDAYSFGMIFWQICSLITPYAGFNLQTHAEKVVRQGHRPKPDPSWPQSWVDLMTACWSADRTKRPSFHDIVHLLEEQVHELEQDGDGMLVPSRTAEIRAKKRKKKVKAIHTQLDVDTRISSSTKDSQKRPEADIV